MAWCMHVCVCVYVHSVCGMVYVVCVCVCGVCDECVWYVWCVCMACPCVRCVWFDVVCMCVCGVCDVCMVEHEETSLRRTLEDKQGSLGWEWRGLPECQPGASWVRGRVCFPLLPWRHRPLLAGNKAVAGARLRAGLVASSLWPLRSWL